MMLALGLPWLLDSLHQFVHRAPHHHAAGSCSSPAEVVWRLLTIPGYTRGLLLFLVFCCKRSVWTRLRRGAVLRPRPGRQGPKLGSGLVNLLGSRAASLAASWTASWGAGSEARAERGAGSGEVVREGGVAGEELELRSFRPLH